MTTARRVGAFLDVTNEEGCRHLLRVGSVQALFDTGVPHRNLNRRRPDHPRTPRRKKGEQSQGIGRSRGGFTSNIRCLADGRGRPVVLALTPGNVANFSMALPLLQALPA